MALKKITLPTNSLPCVKSDPNWSSPGDHWSPSRWSVNTANLWSCSQICLHVGSRLVASLHQPQLGKWPQYIPSLWDWKRYYRPSWDWTVKSHQSVCSTGILNDRSPILYGTGSSAENIIVTEPDLQWDTVVFNVLRNSKFCWGPTVKSTVGSVKSEEEGDEEKSMSPVGLETLLGYHINQMRHK